MAPASTHSSRVRWTVAIGVSLLLVLALVTVAWLAGVFRPGCSAYLESRPELAMLPPGATMLRMDGYGDGHGAVGLDGGNPGSIDDAPFGPGRARWDFTMPSVDQQTTDAVVEFYRSRLAAQGWTSVPDSAPNDWTWKLSDLTFRLNAPQANAGRAQSLVSWTRSWEVTETVGGERAQPPECNWDNQETSFGHVA